MSQPESEQPESRALALAVLGTTGLATKGIFAQLAYMQGAGVPVVVLMRMVLGLPLFWAADRALRPAGRAAMGWRDAGLCLVFGMLFLVATVADFAAIDLLGVALSRIVLFTYPLIVQMVVALMQWQRPSRRQMLAFAIAYAGLLVVLRPWRDGMPEAFWLGLACSACSALTIGAYFALANPLIRRVGAMRFSAMSQVSATLGMVVIGSVFLTAEDFALPAMGWIHIVMIVVVATVAPMLMLYESMRRIGAARTSLLALLGPVITVLLAWAVLGERLDAPAVAGFALVLAGVALLEFRRSSASPPRPVPRY